MSWEDVNLGNCTACGDFRRRYIRADASHGSSNPPLCCPCTLKAAIVGVRAALKVPAQELTPQEIEWRRRKAERYAARIAAGLCRDCGKEPAQPGNQRGVKCSDKHKAREAARGTADACEHTRYMIRTGKCADCGEQASGGRRRCTKCALRHRERERKRWRIAHGREA